MAHKPEKFLFIIGSPKAGTTSLANWLGQHENMVLGTIKEPRYFTDFAGKAWDGPDSDAFRATLLSDEAAYWRNFAPEAGQTPGWAIDASTDYLWCAASAGKIRDFAKEHPSKLICILRDPVERALSEYHHTLRDRLEELSLAASLEAEEERIAKGWQPLFYHKRRSTCLADVNRYAELFGDDLLVLGFHELRDPERLLGKVYGFLGLTGPVVKSEEVHNQSTLPRNAVVRQIFGNERLKSLGRAVVGPGLRSRIRKLTHAPAKALKPTTQSEVNLLRDALADEIAACVASPLVNTDKWTTSIAPAGPATATA